MAHNMERMLGWVESALGSRVSQTTALPGGAGARRYWRVIAEDGQRAVLMQALPEDERILPPQLRARDERLPFVEVTRLLQGAGLPAPELRAVEEAERWVLLEDLGNVHLADLCEQQRTPRLEEAIDLLVKVHALEASDALPFQRRFDEEWIGFELGYFLEYGVASEQRAALAPQLERLAARIAALPACLCLRDFQSQNLMIDPAGRLRILDYQDALLAPAELDLAALLWDSYIEIEPLLRARLLERYAQGRGRALDPAAFALLTVQRKCKDFGRFQFLVEVNRDARWGPARAAAQRAVQGALPALPAEFGALAELLESVFAEPRA